MKPVCRPGDLAVIITAHHRQNIGKIVRVLREHVPVGDLPMETGGLVWDVECPAELVWWHDEKTYRRRRGPAPDSVLWPIRGEPANDQAVTKKVLAA